MPQTQQPRLFGRQHLFSAAPINTNDLGYYMILNTIACYSIDELIQQLSDSQNINEVIFDRGYELLLYCAHTQVSIEIFRFLLEKSARLTNDNGHHILHTLASIENSEQYITTLCQVKNISINDQDIESGDTALHIALAHENYSAAKALLLWDADPTVPNRCALTPIRLAIHLLNHEKNLDKKAEIENIIETMQGHDPYEQLIEAANNKLFLSPQ